jgi:glutamine amidotransferase
MIKNVAIIDYGLGNILSTQQSFLKVANDNIIKANVIITNQPRKITESTHIVLPGQGAFETCMKGLSSIPYMINELTKSVVNKKTPFLGICVGMQLLANISYENGEHKGLGWIDGQIKKLPTNNLKLPHMGWNEVEIINNNKLVEKGKLNEYYFVHSYFFNCEYKKNIIGETDYGVNFNSFISKENIYGVQFHPEKSSKQGLELIKNFLKL